MRGALLGVVILCCALIVPVSLPASATLTISSIDPTGRIAAGQNHTCAISNVNEMWCWGDNSLGQLGSATHSTLMETTTPVRAAALPGGRVPQKISAGSLHTCVLASDGTVWCWGHNGYGAIGVAGGNQADPVQVVLTSTATQIAAGGYETCALLTSGSVNCWGRNNFGQLGNNSSNSTANSTPVVVSSIPSSFSVAHLEVGLFHACAISTVGAVWCWGAYVNGRLGTTSSSNALVPTATASLGASASLVSAGGAHTCVLLASSAVSCFGSNSSGQLGQNTSTTESSTPAIVAGLSANTSVLATGQEFTCALLTTGIVECFGDNASGQLGTGNFVTPRFTPGVVGGLSGTVVDVIAGNKHACAVMSTGQVRCWGENGTGELGIGNKTDQFTPVAIAGLDVMPTTTTSTSTSTTITTTATTTTTASLTATTTTPSTTAVSSTATTTTPSAQSPTSNTGGKKILIAPIRLRIGRTVTAAQLATSVSLAIPKRSWGSMRISIMTGGKRCIFVGTKVKAVRKGACSIAVVLIPKRGKTTIRKTTITIL